MHWIFPQKRCGHWYIACQIKRRSSICRLFNEKTFRRKNNDVFLYFTKNKVEVFQHIEIKELVAKDKEIMLKADKNLFRMMTVISQSRKLDMKEVLSHPLGPKP